MYHSQNKEAEIISNYFGSKIGTLLDIGANDGITFSNSYDLIAKGWSGYLVEPSLAYGKLDVLYRDNARIETVNCAIGTTNGLIDFNEGSDSLLSGFSVGNAAEYSTRQVMGDDFNTFIFNNMVGSFDFLTIDCEGADIDILKQIDLAKFGVRCLCIEHNNKDGEIIDYCKQYGLRPIHRNGENLIFGV